MMKAKRKNTLFKHYRRQVVRNLKTPAIFMAYILFYVAVFGIGFWLKDFKQGLSNLQLEIMRWLQICCCMFPILLLAVFRVLVDVSESGKAQRKSKLDE